MDTSFAAMLDAIARHPSQYTGENSIETVLIFLNGFDAGHAADHSEPRVMPAFLAWIHRRFPYCHPASNPGHLLLHHYGSDHAAIAILPALFEEFRHDLDEFGSKAIERDYRRRLQVASRERHFGLAEGVPIFGDFPVLLNYELLAEH